MKKKIKVTPNNFNYTLLKTSREHTTLLESFPKQCPPRIPLNKFLQSAKSSADINSIARQSLSPAGTITLLYIARYTYTLDKCSRGATFSPVYSARLFRRRERTDSCLPRGVRIEVVGASVIKGSALFSNTYYYADAFFDLSLDVCLYGFVIGVTESFGPVANRSVYGLLSFGGIYYRVAIYELFPKLFPFYVSKKK